MERKTENRLEFSP